MEESEKSADLSPRESVPWLNLKHLKLSEQQRKALPKLQPWLGKRGDKLADCLLRGGTPIDCDAGQMRSLVNGLIREFPQDETDVLLSTLSRVVACRNRIEKFQIRLPESSARIAPTPNPFRPGRLHELADVRFLRDLLVAEIKRNPTLDDQELNYGRILTSALLFGGQVSRSKLGALYDSLPEWTAHAEMAHGRLAVTWTESGGNFRRWLPDALTSLLLLGLPAAPPKVVSGTQTEKQRRRTTLAALTRAILGYLRSAGAAGDPCPKTLSKLLEVCQFDLEVNLPGALVQYAATNQISHSLRPKTWRRLMKEAPVEEANRAAELSDRDAAMSSRNPPAQETADRDEEFLAEDRVGREAGNEETTGPDWLDGLRKALETTSSGGDKSIAMRMVCHYLRYLEDKKKKILLEEPDPFRKLDPLAVAEMFYGFAQDLLTQHTKSRKGNTLKWLRTRIVAVAKRLPGLVRLENPASLNGDTLQGAYQQILEDATSENQRQKLAGHLRAFHRYLVKTRDVEAINEGETFASGDEDLTVDANLILEDEYKKTLLYLKDGLLGNGRPADQRLRKIAGLITILGFRCGLRRMEALKLQLSDLNEQEPAELLVRPWEQRRLKTPNATRKMPLYALLRGRELAQLQEWKLEREAENKDSRRASPFLFSIPEMGYAFVPEWLVFPLIHDALRKATGDQSLHFHHLRHSFASWTVFALMRPPKAPLPGWLEGWPEMSDWLGLSEKLHQDLYGNSFLTRRHLYAVACLLGHSGPAMSLEHYVHIADQLLAAWLEKQMPKFEPALWIAASGIPEPTVYRRLKLNLDGKAESGFWTLVERRGNEVLDQEQRAVMPLIPFGPPNDEIRIEVVPTMPDHLWLLLYLSAKEKLCSTDLAPRFGFSKTLVEALIAVAKEVEPRRFSKKAFLHNFETDKLGNRSPYPRKPREGEDQRIVERLAPRMWELLRTKQDLCGAVLSHFLTKRRNGRYGLEFGKVDRKLAIQYLALLKDLGVDQDDLIILRFAGEVEFAFWEKALRLKDGTTVRAAAPPSPNKSRRNDIGIKVVFSTTDLDEKARTRASYGVNYLMVMAGIWLEARFREQSSTLGRNESAMETATELATASYTGLKFTKPKESGGPAWSI